MEDKRLKMSELFVFRNRDQKKARIFTPCLRFCIRTGHTDIKMTMRYAHLTPDHLQSSIRFMDMVGDKSTSIPVLDLKRFNVSDNLMMLRS